MSDNGLTEEPLRFGEGGRLMGIFTQPGTANQSTQELPVFIFLSAGLLHRVGPYRLHVRLARTLAQKGFCSLRVDLAGRGDSPSRPGFSNQQSASADFEEILEVLEARLGQFTVVLAGLCAGADHAVRLAIDEPRVTGMVLLDPVCFADEGLSGFRSRAIVAKFANPMRYISWLTRQAKALSGPRESVRRGHEPIDSLEIRDLPTHEQLRSSFQSIGEREGQIMSVFTHYALDYYNHRGQLERILGVPNYHQFCSELFWPHVAHTYTLEPHRQQLIEAIKLWADGYILG